MNSSLHFGYASALMMGVLALSPAACSGAEREIFRRQQSSASGGQAGASSSTSQSDGSNSGSSGAGGEASSAPGAGGIAGFAGRSGAGGAGGAAAVGGAPPIEPLPRCPLAGAELAEGERCLLDDFEGAEVALEWGTHRDWGFLPNFELKPEGGRFSSHALHIESSDVTDSGWFRRLDLQRNSFYRISVWVRGDAIATNPLDEHLRGAHVAVSHTPSSSRITFSSQTIGTREFIGTFAWKRSAVTFMTDVEKQEYVTLRLGSLNSAASGNAWFDDLELERLMHLHDRQVGLSLPKRALEKHSVSELREWLAKLNRVYQAYVELTGLVPDYGKRFDLMISEQRVDGEIGDLNPIIWSEADALQRLVPVTQDDDWSYRALFGMASTFVAADYCRFCFNKLLATELLVYYAAEQTGAKLAPVHEYYEGAGLAKHYQDMAFDIPHALVYRFIQISREIGWAPFKQAFRHLDALPVSEAPSNGAERFNLFVAQLTEHSGQDIRARFSTEELERAALFQ